MSPNEDPNTAAQVNSEALISSWCVSSLARLISSESFSHFQSDSRWIFFFFLSAGSQVCWQISHGWDILLHSKQTDAARVVIPGCAGCGWHCMKSCEVHKSQVCTHVYIQYEVGQSERHTCTCSLPCLMQYIHVEIVYCHENMVMKRNESHQNQQSHWMNQ